MKYEVYCYDIVPTADMPVINIMTMDDVDAFMRGELRSSRVPSSAVVYIDDSISPVDDTEIFESIVRRDLEHELGARIKTFNFMIRGTVDEN